MISVKEKILRKIREHKQGWAFSAIDFLKDFKRREIDESLSYLVEDGDIRRVIRGIYDYPMYSSILKRKVAPDIEQVANAIARKFGWNISPDGNTALNYLGLSTQLTSKKVYLSDGPKRKYIIDKIPLEFRHIAKKELIGSKNTKLVVHAIRSAGKEQINEKFISSLSKKFSKTEWKKIKEEACTCADWIYDVIKKATECLENK